MTLLLFFMSRECIAQSFLMLSQDILKMPLALVESYFMVQHLCLVAHVALRVVSRSFSLLLTAFMRHPTFFQASIQLLHGTHLAIGLHDLATMFCFVPNFHVFS